MNLAILMGRLTRDPDVNEKRATFSLAVNRRFKRDGEPDADFLRCVVFGKKIDFVRDYLRQGTKVLVTGEIRVSKFTVTGDDPKTYTDIIVNDIEFAESKAKTTAPQEGFTEADDDALPFE